MSSALCKAVSKRSRELTPCMHEVLAEVCSQTVVNVVYESVRDFEFLIVGGS
jgi:hypothetical protein